MHEGGCAAPVVNAASPIVNAAPPFQPRQPQNDRDCTIMRTDDDGYSAEAVSDDQGAHLCRRSPWPLGVHQCL